MREKVLRGALDALTRKLVSLPLIFAGYFMTVVVYFYRDTTYSETPSLLRWYINPEDWTGGWRGHRAGDNCVPDDLRDRYSGFIGFWRYHAMRNAVGGKKLMKWFTVTMTDEIVYETNEYCATYEDWWLYKYKKPKAGDSWWHVTSMREKYHGFQWIKYFEWRGKLRVWEVKIGWRIAPSDAHASEDDKMNSGRWTHGTTATFQSFAISTAGEDWGL